jgi:hydroxyacylglutathione hydrolase
MMTEFRDGNLIFKKLGPLGRFGNNAYVIADAETNEALVVDAPEESERIVEATAGLDVRRIVVTHRHGDHWMGIDLLRERLGAPVSCHEADKQPYEAKVADTLADGDEIKVGQLSVRVIHTPGHTPGSICLLVNDRLISGDTLFPGGPGRTMRPEDLRQEIESIKTKLYSLPESVRVHPGHGDDTTIAVSKAEYAIFEAKSHPDDLCGDVTWANS